MSCALLQERALSSSSEWRSQIQAVDREVLSHLQHNIAGGFDQERFGPSIGFGNLKRYGAVSSAGLLPEPETNLVTILLDEAITGSILLQEAHCSW